MEERQEVLQSIMLGRQPVTNGRFDHVYFLFSGDELVYVGQSVHMYARVDVHIREGKMQFDSFSYLSLSQTGHESLNEAEAYYVVKFRPKYNNRIPKNSRYLTLRAIRREYDLENKITNLRLGRRLFNEIEDKIVMCDSHIYFSAKEVEEKIDLISAKHYKKLQP